MIKNLIAAAMASILITQPPQNANDETYYQDVNITESYEYETNEVNSVDDLVIGNIYQFNTNRTYDGLRTGKIFNLKRYSYLLIDMIDINYEDDITYLQLSNYTVQAYVNSAYEFGINGLNFLNASFIYEGYGSEYYEYFSASDYLGEKTITVERVETEGLYNLAYHFLYSRIYTNTELQGMETTLFGTTINMNMWLSHTTATVIICLLLIVLIKFVIWLFKIVSGGMLWQ